MLAASLTIMEKVALLKAASLAKAAKAQALAAAEAALHKEPIPLEVILALFEKAGWETMQANNWAGFKALVKTFGPVKIPSYPKQNFPFIFCNWEISKIAEILQTSVHEVGLTFLYNKYPHLKYEAPNKPNEGVDK